MWPQTLQMTRDECRGILRRLELESYSQVISVFRAQGGLSDAKLKLLDELRNMFHISQERHRAEARRVANDEQLSTIAEAISGPNTWQEWSREGRRPYALLPRVAPQTALSLIANSLAGEAYNENVKLPYPSETGEYIKAEQQAVPSKLKRKGIQPNYVVTDDPFKVPDIPTTHRKNLKRNISEKGTGVSKKRALMDNTMQKSAISTTNNKHSTAQQKCTQNPNNAKKLNSQITKNVQQQQQLPKQKMSKKAVNNNNTNNKNNKNSNNNNCNNTPNSAVGMKRQQVTPAKSGRRTQKMIEHQQQLLLKQQESELVYELPPQFPASLQANQPQALQIQLQQHQHPQQQQQQQLPQPPPSIPPPLLPPSSLQKYQNELQYATLASQTQTTKNAVMNGKQCSDTSLVPLAAPASISSTGTHIAASKRDITKNLNKLHSQQMQYQKKLHNMNNASVDAAASVGNSSLVKQDKSAITTTPVQKYIVENRQPGASLDKIISPTHLNTSGAASNITGAAQVISMPQFTTATTNLRSINTNLIQPAQKNTMAVSKKIVSLNSISYASSNSTHSPINASALHELANVATNQTQAFNVGSSINATAVMPFNKAIVPVYTSPAILQLQNSTSTTHVPCVPIEGIAAPQGKVLTTKLLPIVLASAANQINSAVSSNAISVSSPISASVNMSSTAFTPTRILHTNTSNFATVSVAGNNTIFSTLGASSKLIRKTPNILKSPNSKGNIPHILSNVKFTPVSITSTASGLTTANSYRSVIPASSAMLRTNVKICQSPNGKVFIQPANFVDGSQLKFNTRTLQQKLVPIATSSTVTTVSNLSPTGSKRISLERFHLLPALAASTTTPSLISSKATTLSLSPANSANSANLTSLANSVNLSHSASPINKTGTMLLPFSTPCNVKSVSLSKVNNLLVKSTNTGQSPIAARNSSTETTVTPNKPNIVVLENTILKEQSINYTKIDNSQLLIEDGPLDILNMPIVMESGPTIGSAESITVLDSALIRTNATPIITVQQPQLMQTPQQTQPIVLSNIDWEMELDHAVTTSVNNNNEPMHVKCDVSKSKSSNNQIVRDYKQNYIIENKNQGHRLTDVLPSVRANSEMNTNKSSYDNTHPGIGHDQAHSQIQLKDTNVTKTVNINSIEPKRPIILKGYRKRNACANQPIPSNRIMKTTVSRLGSVQHETEIDVGFDKTIATSNTCKPITDTANDVNRTKNNMSNDNVAVNSSTSEPVTTAAIAVTASGLATEATAIGETVTTADRKCNEGMTSVMSKAINDAITSNLSHKNDSEKELIQSKQNLPAKE